MAMGNGASSGCPNGLEIFSAWILILQIASKCPVRGILSDEDGPLTAEDMSFKTGAPIEFFETAINVLSGNNFQWIEAVNLRESPDVPGDSPEISGDQPEISGASPKISVLTNNRVTNSRVEKSKESECLLESGQNETEAETALAPAKSYPTPPKDETLQPTPVAAQNSAIPGAVRDGWINPDPELANLFERVCGMGGQLSFWLNDCGYSPEWVRHALLATADAAPRKPVNYCKGQYSKTNQISGQR